MTTIKEAKQILKDNFHDEGSVSFYRGVFTVREGYFYTHGRSQDDVVAKVRELLPEAKILDSGNHWAAFNGGASLKRSSHWWVKLQLVFSK